MEEEEIERAAQTFYPPQHTRAEEIEDEEAYLRDFFKEEDEKFIRERDASIARDKICCAAGALIFAAGVIGSGFYLFKSKVFLLLLFFGGAAMGVFFVAMKLACTEKKMRNSAKGHRLIRPFALNVYVAGTAIYIFWAFVSVTKTTAKAKRRRTSSAFTKKRKKIFSAGLFKEGNFSSP